MNLRVLHQDEHLIAIDKPAGFHVHPPEDRSHRISRNENCLFLLRKQTGRFLYPVHRLDRATSGILLFAFESEVARDLSLMFQRGEVEKTYCAVTRGWTDQRGEIDYALSAEHDPGEKKASVTRYERLAVAELPIPVGRYGTARYSLLSVQPLTGRMHQIRRHFAHLSHPLLGDTIYGDGRHNRVFREHLEISKLLLKAQVLKFRHPRTGSSVLLRSRWDDSWHRVFEVFGFCPVYRG